MKRFRNLFAMSLAAIFAAFVLSGCEYVKSFFSSPSRTVKKYLKALENYDAKAVEKCLSSEITDEEDFSKQLKNSLKEQKKKKIKLSLKEIAGEEIDDDEATVECVIEISVGKEKKGTGKATYSLVKEDDEWLLTKFETDEDFSDIMAEINGYKQPNYHRLAYLQGKYLGEAIKKAVPKVKKIAVLVSPNVYYDIRGEKRTYPIENKELKGLRDALPGVEFVVIYKSMKKGEKSVQEMTEEDRRNFFEESRLTREDFKKLLKEIKKAEVFVAIEPFPGGMSLTEVLTQLKGMKVALGDWNADIDELPEVFQDKGRSMAEVIAAVKEKLTYDSNYNFDADKELPSDDQEAFDMKFVLITPKDYQKKIREAGW